MVKKISALLSLICLIGFLCGCYEEGRERGTRILIRDDGTVVVKKGVITGKDHRIMNVGAVTDRNGNLYQPRYGKSQVEIYDKNKNLIRSFKTNSWPTDIVMADDGNLYISEARPGGAEAVFFAIEKFSSEGKLIDNLNQYLDRSQKGIAGLDMDYGYVPAIDIGEDGDLYIVVIEEQRGISEVRKFYVNQKKWETIHTSSNLPEAHP